VELNKLNHKHLENPENFLKSQNTRPEGRGNANF
jgi:hypothetical protein